MEHTDMDYHEDYEKKESKTSCTSGGALPIHEGYQSACGIPECVPHPGTILTFEGNAIYELDEECLQRKRNSHYE